MCRTASALFKNKYILNTHYQLLVCESALWELCSARQMST